MCADIPVPPEPDLTSCDHAYLFLAALAGGGVGDVVMCPGSRSAPLAYAASWLQAEGRIRLHTRLDERSAGFFALGLARASDAPVVVATTSGSAPVHLHPALLEASHSHVGLVVVSADRPWNLQGVGASQTTRQVGIFDPHVKLTVEIPALVTASTTGEGDRAARTLARQLGNLTRRVLKAARCGPVHVNFAFTEPLHPRPDYHRAHRRIRAAAQAWKETGLTTVGTVADNIPTIDPAHVDPVPQAVANLAEAVDLHLRTVIVAGDFGKPLSDRAIARIGELAGGGRPLLAEPSSGLAAPCGDEQVNHWFAPHQQTCLHRWAEEVEQVIVLGRPTLSRPVNGLLGREDVRVVVISENLDYPDVTGNAAVVVGVAPQDLKLPPATAPVVRWARNWVQRARQLTRQFDTAQLPAGVRVAQLVWQARRDSEDLLVGSSNPIRYVDLIAAESGKTCIGRVWAQRGLAGIDGTVSHAHGIAAATAKAVRVLVGDLTFLHDASSLLRHRDDHTLLEVVVIDDNGGRIFHSLEHGEAAPPDVYEQCFALSDHPVDYAHLASAYGWEYVLVDWATTPDPAARLRRLLETPISANRIVHVRCDHSRIRNQLATVFR